MKFDLHTPCKDCPFLSTRKFPLRRARVADILSSIIERQESFPCHKTITHDDEDGGHIPTKKDQHCAGALILLERIERPNQMMRIAERLGFYDRTKLDMSAKVFATPTAMRRAKHWSK